MFLKVFKEVDLVALGKGDNGFLPVIAFTHVLSDPFGLAVHISGPDLIDFDVEHLLNCFLDLYLVSLRINLDHDLVVNLLQPHTFLGKTSFLDHIANVIHDSNLFSSCPRQA